MKLYILGSGCALPSPRRGSPGLALIVEEELILIDTGSGSLRIYPYCYRSSWASRVVAGAERDI